MTMTKTKGIQGGPIDRLLARIEDWINAGRGELDGLSADKVRQMAGDLGLDVNDLSRLAALEGDSSKLLYQRLEGLGLTMEMIEAKGVGARRDMERTCGLCADRALCAHDLAERPDSPEWRKICPNSWTFDEMERRAKVASPNTGG